MYHLGIILVAFNAVIRNPVLFQSISRSGSTQAKLVEFGTLLRHRLSR